MNKLWATGKEAVKQNQFLEQFSLWLREVGTEMSHLSPSSIQTCHSPIINPNRSCLAMSLSTPGRVSHMHTPSRTTYLFLIVMNIGTGNTNSPNRENLSRVPLGRRKLQLSAARSVQRKREGHVYTLQNAFICTAFLVLPCYQLITKTKKNGKATTTASTASAVGF